MRVETAQQGAFYSAIWHSHDNNDDDDDNDDYDEDDNDDDDDNDDNDDSDDVETELCFRLSCVIFQICSCPHETPSSSYCRATKEEKCRGINISQLWNLFFFWLT